MRLALFIAASTLAAAAQAGVTVTFVEPDKYTDIGRFSRSTEPAKVMKDLEAHLVKLGQRLPPNQNLAIEVLDIDLAGDDRWAAASGYDVRIQTGRADWPSMRVRYTLERDGRKESREERIADMSYQQRVQPVSPTETLPHEKRMLTDWFQERFGAAPQARLMP
jgi:hypothetical protein